MEASKAEKAALVPVNEFPWPGWSEIGGLFEVTCTKHTAAKYLTKHPAHRSLHWVGWEPFSQESKTLGFAECACKYEELAVVVMPDSYEAEQIAKSLDRMVAVPEE